MKRAAIRLLQSLAIASGAPLGWMSIRILQGASVHDELNTTPGLYLYMLVGSLAAFGCFGFLIGRREDELLAINERLDTLAITDWLTGLRNARYFHARLAEEFADAQRARTPLAVVIVDLDFFKRINDQYGHLTGDDVLTAVARAISEVTRRGETEARVGGEEFAMLLPGSDGEAAFEAAERVRAAIAAVTVPLPGGTGAIRVTASAGVASTADLPVTGPRELYRAADEALYQAKSEGRNRTILATPPRA